MRTSTLGVQFYESGHTVICSLPIVYRVLPVMRKHFLQINSTIDGNYLKAFNLDAI